MENVAINTRKKFTMDKYFSQVKIVTPNNISKLFGVYVRSVISSVELVNNFLLVNGKIIANAVYLSDENKIENTEITYDFVEKQKSSVVLSELVAEDDLEVQNLSTSSSEIMCSVVHTTQVTGVYRYLVGDAQKADDDLVLSEKVINCLDFKCSNGENFVVVEEAETNLKDIKILNIDSHPILNSVISSVDKVVIDGKVKINALYKDDSGLGEIVKEIEFKQELAMKDALPGMPAEVVLRHLNTAITEQVKDDKTKIVFVIDLSAKAFIFDRKELESFDDVFSLKNEISPIYDYLEFCEKDGLEFDNDTFLTQSDISNIQDFDDIIGVFEPTVKILEIQDLGDKMLVSTEIKALAIYRTQASIGHLDLVYQNKYETEKDASKKLKEVRASASVSAFKVKAGKDLECAFQVEYEFLYEKENIEKYVKNFDVIKEKTDMDAGVKVYIVKENQSLFEVAKALNVKPELITQQTEVSDYFEVGQKVYVYCPLNFA